MAWIWSLCDLPPFWGYNNQKDFIPHTYRSFSAGNSELGSEVIMPRNRAGGGMKELGSLGAAILQQIDSLSRCIVVNSEVEKMKREDGWQYLPACRSDKHVLDLINSRWLLVVYTTSESINVRKWRSQAPYNHKIQ